MLTSFCYMPAVGIAMAGTTLVGQAIGAKTPDWARTAGNGIILLAVLYMGSWAWASRPSGPWVLPWFTNASDPQAQVVAEGAVLLVDRRGLSALRRTQHLERCMSARRGRRAAALAHGARVCRGRCSCRWHMPLSFKPGAGWVSWLPQYGLGAVGGWLAALVYICCLGTMLFLRWHSGAWRRVVLR